MTGRELVDGVDWPAVFDELDRCAGDHVRRRCKAVGADDHVTFAAFVFMEPMHVLHALCLGGTAATDDEISALQRWLHATAPVFWARRMVTTPVEVHKAPREGGGLQVDKRLAGRLPLLELARVIATQRGSLAVVVGRLDERAYGYFQSATNTIVVDLDAMSTDELAGVFAHELAHAADPRLATRDDRAAEWFADTLTPLLLEHMPTSVDELNVLIDRIEPHAPVSDVDEEFLDLAAFHLLPLRRERAVMNCRRDAGLLSLANADLRRGSTAA